MSNIGSDKVSRRELMGPLAKTNFYRYWPAWLVMLGGFGVSGGLGWNLYQHAVELDRERLERISKVIEDELDGRVEKTELILRQAQDYFGNQQVISSTLFRDWCRKHAIAVNLPWAHGLAFYTNKNTGVWRHTVPSEPSAWTTNDFHLFDDVATKNPIKLRWAQGSPHPKNRWPTNYLSQLSFGAPEQACAAITVNTPKSTSRQVVIKDTNGAPMRGAALIAPVYAPERDKLLDQLSGNVEVYHLNWNLCRGVLIAPIDYRQLELLIWGKRAREVGVEIFAHPEPVAEFWLNDTGEAPKSLATGFKCYLMSSFKWKMYGQVWFVRVYTLPLFEAHSPRRMAWLAAGAGSGITLLASVLVAVSLRARARQEGMTAEVIEARDALAAAEQEREKLGHDLHDGAIQSLYAIQLGLSRTAEAVASTLPEESHVLSETRQRLDDVIAELRQFILVREESTAGSAHHLGLENVLAAMIQRLQPSTSMQLKLEAEPGASGRLSTSQAVQLTQIARTALANCLRHARAQAVKISLSQTDGAVRLEIADNGVGFDLHSVSSGGLGLRTMRTRAAEAGGTISVNSSPESGTRVTITIPQPDELSRGAEITVHSENRE
jgi:signal transduction histidine kinase